MSYFTQDSTIDQGKLAPRPTGSSVGDIAISGSSGAFGTASGSYVNVTNLTVTLQASGNGRPFYFGLESDGSGTVSNLGPALTLRVLRDGNEIATYTINVTARIPSTIWGLDFPSAGNSHVYVVQALSLGGTININQVKLVVWEI